MSLYELRQERPYKIRRLVFVVKFHGIGRNTKRDRTMAPVAKNGQARQPATGLRTCDADMADDASEFIPHCINTAG